MEKSRSRASSIPCSSLPPLPLQAEIAEVEGLLGYRFSDASLIAEALTHPSFAERASYQRLEFVGDAALGLAFAKHFFLNKSSLDPGKMTVLRAANISNAKLARVAVRHSLYRFLRRNNTATLDHLVFSGILEPIITEEQPVTAIYLYCEKKGKKVDFKNRKESSLTITNVFVDGELLGVGSSKQQVIAKLNAARDALESLSSSEPLPNGSAREEKNCSKQKLHELCAKKHWPKPVYRIETDEGPSHDKKFVCSVRVVTSEEDHVAFGDPKSRVKDSQSSAASKMLCQISCSAEQGWDVLQSTLKIFFLFFVIHMFLCFLFVPYGP